MATNIFTKAKQIRKKHPNKKWQDCVKEAGKLNGIKKPAKVTGVKRKRKAKIAAKPKAIGKAKVGKKPQGSITGLSRHLKVVDSINRMEKQYRSTSDPLKKKVLAVAINKEHDKLDRIFKK